MEAKRALRMAVILLAAALSLSGAGLGGMLWYIHRSVVAFCAEAQQAHRCPGDNVGALIEFMNSEAHSYRARNRAIWCLGRLRDPRALPALRAVYTGGECDHARALCQYELAKAIKRCEETIASARRDASSKGARRDGISPARKPGRQRQALNARAMARPTTNVLVCGE